MRLVIGNKNYSSWSMRPWVLMQHFGIAFEEVKLRFDFSPGSDFYRQLSAFTPTGKVPVLLPDDAPPVWDTLAIVETLAERFPQHAVWPRDAAARARARSVCAEMHGGFMALRQNCPQNLEAMLPDVGARLMAEEEGVRRDLARAVSLWRDALQASGGPFLFGEFSAADAYYAPVAGRIRTYALPVPQDVAAYVERLWELPAVAQWVQGALAEQDFLDFEEPYRQGPDRPLSVS